MAINRIKTGGITDGTIKSEDIAPGTIANDRLAGSIANAKLANSNITINGTSINLGATYLPKVSRKKRLSFCSNNNL